MNYLAAINNFWSMNEIHSFHSNEIALYFYLLRVNNLCSWKESFKHNNYKIMAAINISSFKTLSNARNKLKQSGLIDFKTKNGSAETEYSLSTLVKNTKVKDEVSDEVWDEVMTRLGMSKDKLNKTSSSFKKEAKGESDDLEFPEEEIEIEKPVINPDEEKEKSCAKNEKEIIEYFHEQCSTLPRVQLVNDTRKKAIKARIKDVGVERVMQVIRLTGESSFLNGENDRGWSADFDWIMKPTNFTKILEGNYRNRTNGHNQTTSSGSGNKGPVQANQVQRRNNQFTIDDFTVPS
ncbi:hypothetical protein ELBR111191_14705 [Elizabethkingia bruuniana]|nr:hypothetical protein AYC65_02795 [Elizabethkingia bruuniana]OPB64430.1 hypothetical protein BAY12_06435 [Elizabethkingia bruuniana]QDZ63261.1 hypothetical protein EVD20_12285 [Elizabethkingia bruuniana]